MTKFREGKKFAVQNLHTTHLQCYLSSQLSQLTRKSLFGLMFPSSVVTSGVHQGAEFTVIYELINSGSSQWGYISG